MHAKIGYGVLGVTVAFLLATNPVVVNAAGFIGSAQIKNNSIKSKDIKNNQVQGADVKDGSLGASDLAAGTVPVEVKAVRRLSFEGSTALTNGVKVFAESAPVTVDANDVIVVSASLMISATEGEDIDFETCFRAVGGVGTPTQLDSVDMFDVDAPATGQNIYPVQGSAVLPAGSYDVGACVNPFSGTHTLNDAAGTVMVFDGTNTGALGKPANAASSPRS